ncbi:MAG: beta-lactamase family protein [Bacilli bacterium]|nr:beta-lactamase family protein [Bacilli bacterium]
MIKRLKEIAVENNLNTYFICEADSKYNIKKEVINPANPTCNCYSVAKAFTVTAIGLLYDKGLVTPNTLLVDIFRKYYPSDIDPKWMKVTIHDVLLHKVGFGTGLLDIDCEDASLYPTNDYLKIVLSTELKYEPGTVFQYTDAAYYLLSRVVSEVSGIELSEFLRPLLMDTMKFKEYAWSKCPLGHAIGATGLYIRTEDMVKLGILYLNKGIWNSERILSEEWIKLVIDNRYEFTHIGNGWYAKGGMRGQFLMFNYDEGKAVACHSYDDRARASLFIK